VTPGVNFTKKMPGGSHAFEGGNVDPNLIRRPKLLQN
jgi:hypothetical protein